MSMGKMRILSRLVFDHHVKRWARALLSLAGIAVSVCLVVWIIRGYDAVASRSKQTASRTTGKFDVAVSPPMPRMGPPGGGPQQGAPRRPPPGGGGAATAYVDPQLIDQLVRDADVSEVSALVKSRVRVVDPQPLVPMGPFGGGSLIGIGDREPPSEMDRGSWLPPGAAAEAVVSSSFAERYGLKVGGETTIGGFGSEVRLTVVGVLKSPGGGGPMSSPQQGDVYVSMATAEKINGYAGRVSAACVTLKDTDDTDSFIRKWTAKTASANPPVSFRSLRQSDDDPMAGRMLGMIQMQANNATVLGFLAACFIIFVTLNAGVRERLREYAALRAIAMSRRQLAFMIFLESFLLALVGWALGLALARALLNLGQALAVHLKFFQSGAFADYPLGRLSILISAGCALTGAGAAAIVPAWQASRVMPIDILGGGDARRGARRFPWIMVGIGLALVVINPLMVLAANVEPFKSYFAATSTRGFSPPLLGSAAVIIGLALITPLFIRVVELVFGPVLAWALRMDRRLLRQQFSSNLWRAVGTTIALSTGLTLFVTVLVWGYSMLVPFTPDQSLPRMLVSILPAGLPESALPEVEQVPGVIAGECLPLAVEQPRLTDAMLESKPFASVDASQQHLLILGVNPAKALTGADPLLRFTFVQGTREEAARKLASGHYCLVPDHFHTQTGLGVGDKFSVSVPEAPQKSVEYEIAGVVYVPGWHWFTKFADIRRRSGRALAMVFAGYETVKADFGIDRISFLWLNADPSVGFQEMEKRLSPLADRSAGVRVNIPGTGEAMVHKQYVKITERENLIGRLNQRADDVIWSLTHFPLFVLIIASLAVFNAVFASVHARFWQFGVLRGVGMTRSQLFRLIVSEALMIFLVAGLLSLGSGSLLAWCGTHICTYFFYFGGMTPPLVLPWMSLSLGFSIAFVVCLIAGLLPAVPLSAKEPLKFIQAGRGTM